MKKARKNKNNKSVSCHKLPTTPSLPTTRYYINSSWGLHNLNNKNKNKNIIIEQINPMLYLYNKNNKIKLAQIEPIEEYDPFTKKSKVLGKGFIIDDELYLFTKNKKIQDVRKFYNVPSEELVREFVEGNVKVRPFNVLMKEMSSALKVLFDFVDPLDVEVSCITIAQSWVKPLRDEFFYYGVDASFGGGKTTLGEIVYFLQRHGFVGGDMSSASIPRLVDDMDLNIFIDEIDQNRQDENIQNILRKGQRRGNPYVRCEGRDNVPVAFEVAGCHGFSYRSELEDAFLNRSLRIHTAKTNDHQTAIVNIYKKEVLKPLADEIFLWFIQNIHVVSCSRKRRCIGKSMHRHFFDFSSVSRRELYENIVNKFSKKEKKYLENLFGRDSELAYLCLEVAKMLDYDIIDSLEKIMNKKVESDKMSESFHLDNLRHFISDNLPEIYIKKLKEGLNEGCYYFPKNKLYQIYVTFLKENNMGYLGTKKFNSILRELGFSESTNLKSERYEKVPTACLIFNKYVVDKNGWKLNELNSEKEKEKEIVKEFTK